MNRYTIPDFKVSLALVDALPVILFSIDMLMITTKFHSTLFLIGAVLCTISGLLKVLWKFIVALYKKNIWPLFIQMRICMPVGFILMILSMVISNIWGSLLKVLFIKPSCYFFIMTALLMGLMMFFGYKLDNSVEKNNWIEQFTNALAQLSLLIGIVLL